MSHDIEKSNQRVVRALVASAVITGLLYVIPFGSVIAYPLLLLSTLVHELGHGIAAVLVGGEFTRFALYSDGSGVAYNRLAGGAFAHAFVSAGGLIGPAVCAGALFALSKYQRATKVGLLLMGGALLLVDLMLVSPISNPFGFFFIGGFAALSLWVGLKAKPAVCQFYSMFVAVQLALSVFSRSDYLFVKEASTGAGLMDSDVQQIANHLFLPYWFWGGACGLFSVLVLCAGLYVGLPRSKTT